MKIYRLTLLLLVMATTSALAHAGHHHHALQAESLFDAALLGFFRSAGGIISCFRMVILEVGWFLCRARR